MSFETPKGPKVAIYSKKSYFSEKIIPFSYLLLAKSMKFILKLKNHTIVASVQMVVTIFAQKVIRVGDKHLVFLIAKKILPSKMEKIRFFQKVTPIFFFTDDI